MINKIRVLNDNWRNFMQPDNKKVYSGIDSLPRGSAPDTIIPGCMVLEGGAFRGLYGEGVLDYLMQAGINLQCTIGVSAGACNGWHYVSGQIGRSARVNLGCRHDPRYVGAIAMKENAGLMGFKYFFEDYAKEYDDPFDLERFNRPDRRYIAVATNCRTGKPVCFEKGRCKEIDQALRASASMPYLSRPVMVEGKPCLDGGCSVKVPFRWALRHEFEKIVVIRTREREYRRDESSFDTKMAGIVYHNYPKLAAKLKTSPARANRECDQMDRLEAEGRIFVIAPSKPVTVGRVEGDMERLGALYRLGYQDAEAAMPALKHYLAAD